MKRDKPHAILGSLMASVNGDRGHRSVDENYLSAAVAAAGKQPAHSKCLNVKGWNNSTRASPLWKPRGHDKENGKVAVPQKFRDVQSKLNAPIYSQRRSLLARPSSAGATGLGRGPLQNSPGILNMTLAATGQPSFQGNTHEGVGAGSSPKLVTMRRQYGAESLTGFEGPMRETAAPMHGRLGNGDIAACGGFSLEDGAADRSLEQRLSPHPSVTALYQYAQEVRSPVSDASESQVPEALLESLGAAAVDIADGSGSEAQSEELTCSFASWLTYMSLDTVPLPDGTIAKLRALWNKAKEATELQAHVKKLRESESRIAQQGLHTVARDEGTYELRAGAQEGLQSPKTRLEKLLEAEERLAELAVCSPQMKVATAQEAAVQPAVGSDVAGWDTQPAYLTPHVISHLASPVASVPLAAKMAPPSTGVASVEGDANSASVASWTYQQEHDVDRALESYRIASSPAPATDMASCPYPDLSPTPTCLAQQGAESVSLGSQMQPCDSSSASFAAGTPGLSVLSRPAERIRFSAWADGINCSPLNAGVVAGDAPTAVTAELHGLSIHGVGIAPSPGFSPALSAGLSVASQLQQPVAFEEWDRARRERDPLAAIANAKQQAPVVDANGVSPAPSAGLSVVSELQQPIAFKEWDKAQHERAPLATSVNAKQTHVVNASGASPAFSAGLSVASQLPPPVAFEVWDRVHRERASFVASAQQAHAGDGSVESPAPAGSGADKSDCTPVWPPNREHTPMHPPKGAKASEGGGVGGAQIRSNPLFECDSPASSLTTPLPERTDTMPGLLASPSPAHKPAIPSLASTPMSEGDGVESRLTSPLGSERNRSPTSSSHFSLDGDIPGLFGDMPTPAPGAQITSLTPGSPGGLQLDDSSSHMSEGQAPSVGMLEGAIDRYPSPLKPCAASAREPTCQVVVEDAAESPGEATCVNQSAPGKGTDTSCDCSAKEPTTEGTRVAVEDTGTPDSCASVSPAGMQPDACVSLLNDPGSSDTTYQAGTADVAASESAAEEASGNPEGEPTRAETSPREDTKIATAMGHTSSASEMSTPSVASGAVQEPASGNSSGGGTDDGATCKVTLAQSFPSTPSAPCPATPMSIYVTPYEEFPTPTPQKPYASKVQSAAMRRLGNPSTPIRPPVSDPSMTANFTFGQGPTRLHGAGTQVEAPTPDLALGAPAPVTDPAGATCSEMATPASQPTWPGMVGFGSPLPLQLTPIQMRVLDHLADQVIAAISPVVHAASPASANGSPATMNVGKEGPAELPNAHASDAAAFAGYNFAQFLAQIHSPMPVPMHQQARRATAHDCSGPTQDARSTGAVLSQADQQAADALTAQPEHANVASQPLASPMPSFAKLMAFLNAARRPTADVDRTTTADVQPQPVEYKSHGSAPQSGCGAGAPPKEISDAVAAAAVFSFAQLVAYLRSPKVHGQPVRPNPSTAATILAAPACVESPITALGAQDSPATSEAASFGFSTAAKQMEIRRTPATCTPGDGGVSFLRWARDAPPTFQLDSDPPRPSGRGRTPSTPVSFSFGARLHSVPSMEDATPAVGIRANSDILRMSRVGVAPLRFSASGQLSEAGDRVSPANQRGHHRASSLGGLELRSDEPSPFTLAANPGAAEPMPAIGVAGSSASPAFSFGPQLARLPFLSTTPAAVSGQLGRNNSATPDRKRASQLRASSYSVFGASPAPSLGPWVCFPGRPTPASACANAETSPTELAFTFGNCNAQALATPMWAGLAGAAAAAAVALKADMADDDCVRNVAAALEQVVVAVSPTLFGAGGTVSPLDTPGVNQRFDTPVCRSDKETAPAPATVPGPAAFWAALMGGGLHSPMPAGVHGRLYQDTTQGEHKSFQQQPTTGAPSLDTMPISGGVTAKNPSPAAVASETLSAASSTGSAVFSSACIVADATSLPKVAANATSLVAVEERNKQGEAPPSYKDLPNLIARGLCLSASSSVQQRPSAPEPGTASAVKACSSMGENPTPKVCCAPDTGGLITAIVSETSMGSTAPEVASTQAMVAGSPAAERLFRPVVGHIALSETAVGASANSELALMLESISDSNRSAVDMASVDVARTTEPLPTPSRLPHTAFSGCNTVVQALGASVQESPVWSFHAPSTDRATATNTASSQLAETLGTSPVAFPRDLHTPVGATSQGSQMTLPGAIRSVAGEQRTVNGPLSSSHVPALSTIEAPSVALPGMGTDIEPVLGLPRADAPLGPFEPSCEALPLARVEPADVSTSAEQCADPAEAGDEAVSPIVSTGVEAAAEKQALEFTGVPAATGSAVQSEEPDTSAVGPEAADVCCPSPPPCIRMSSDAWQPSPATFSYLSSGAPPATPPTAELATMNSRGVASVAGQQPPGGCGQFWAPSPSNRIAASSERVTLEAPNRRIRMSADLLLDFQGSPGQPMHVNPTPPGSGNVTPRMKSPGLLGRSGSALLRKSWDVGFSLTSSSILQGHSVGQASPQQSINSILRAGGVESRTAAPPMGSRATSASGAAPLGKGIASQSGRSPGGLLASSRARTLLSGQGPPLQQLVAAGIDNAFASAAATVMQPSGGPVEHMPISRRLGMWPSAVWSIAGVAAAKQPNAVASTQGQGAVAMPTQKTAPGKPHVANRDVQTTPSLGRCAFGAENKAPDGLKSLPGPQAGAKPAISQQPLFAAARPGGFRSRIPAPASLAVPLSSLDINGIPASAPASARLESSMIPAQRESSLAAPSGDEDTEDSIPVERVIRRRRLLTTAGALGGAQRVPVKGGAQRPGMQPPPAAGAMGEDEMRRRARVLGVRISPYLKSKAPRVKLSEAQPPKKG